MTTNTESTWIHRSPFHRSGRSLADVFTPGRRSPQRAERARFAREIAAYPATRGVGTFTQLPR
jgi:hypothetical protein